MILHSDKGNSLASASPTQYQSSAAVFKMDRNQGHLLSPRVNVTAEMVEVGKRKEEDSLRFQPVSLLF